MGVYGPCTQGKYLFKALVFGTCKQNIYIYSHVSALSVTATTTGLQSGKKSINWISVGILEILR